MERNLRARGREVSFAAVTNRWELLIILSRWFVDAPEDVAKERVVKRHLAAGIESTREAAEARVESNDLLNGRLIREQRVTPDLIIQN